MRGDGVPLGRGPAAAGLQGARRRDVAFYGRSGLALRRGSPAAAAAPRLVADGAVRHAPKAELGQRPNVVALEAHQRNQHLVALPIEDGGRAATTGLGISAGWGERLVRTRKHRRGNFVEHGGPADEQADLTPARERGTSHRAAGGLALQHLSTARRWGSQWLTPATQVRRQGVTQVLWPSFAQVQPLGRQRLHEGLEPVPSTREVVRQDNPVQPSVLQGRPIRQRHGSHLQPSRTGRHRELEPGLLGHAAMGKDCPE